MAENERKRGFPVLGIAYALLALSAVVGLSTLFGFVGPKSGFQWELASIFGTALGTTLLAVATGLSLRSGDECWINVQLVNAGPGPALRIEVTGTYADPEHQPEVAMPRSFGPVDPE